MSSPEKDRLIFHQAHLQGWQGPSRRRVEARLRGLHDRDDGLLPVDVAFVVDVARAAPGLAEYFQMPLKTAIVGGKTVGMDNSIIEGGGRDISSEEPGAARRTDGKTQLAQRSSTMKTDDELLKAAANEMERREQERLHDLQIKLMAAIEANPTMRQFR